MTLVKTSFYTGLATAAKLISGFLINKAIALYIGPEGLAAVGQFRNFLTLSTTFSSGATNTGLVKYVSEYREQNKSKNIIQTALSFGFLVSLIFSLVLILFRNQFSLLLFNENSYSYLFVIFALTISFFSLNSLLISVLNGKRQIKILTLVNISNSLVALLLTVALTYWFKLTGVLVALVINQSVVFLITILLVYKLPWYVEIKKKISLNKRLLIDLIKFSLITATSIFFGSLSVIFVRRIIISSMGWEIAGYWEALWQFSSMYLSFITATLSVYYLPKLSGILDPMELKKEIIRVSKTVLPIVALVVIMIYIFRSQITLIIFSKEFLPISDFYLYQLIGDFIKMASWLLSFVLVAKAMIKETVLSTIFINIIFVFLVKILAPTYGLSGVTIAYLINYFIYLVLIIFIIKRSKLLKNEETNLLGNNINP